MSLPTTLDHSDLISKRIAETLVEGFDRHYRLFHAVSADAKRRFDDAAWLEGQQSVRDRIQFYDDRVKETSTYLLRDFHAERLSDEVWQQTKLLFVGLLTNHKQPELAETFFNSVSCRILDRTYFHNDYLFARPAISTAYNRWRSRHFSRTPTLLRNSATSRS